MPHIKPLTQQPFARMTRLLRGYGFTGPTLAQILGCTAPTARDRILHPERLTLGDLDNIRRRGHVPWEEIQAAMTGGGS